MQLNTAAVDKRIDALVPEISWGNLVRDLLPGGVLKQTWDLILYGGGERPWRRSASGLPPAPRPPLPAA
ncbi:MAG: hypothetical protein ACR2H7_01525 [Actinomycetota bacterium]